MKNKFTYIAVFALLGCSTLFACKKEKPVIEEPEEPKPTAAFNHTLVSPNDPFTYKFENGSTQYKDIRWEFGDDSTTTDLSPTHTFIETGDYRVRMISTNGQGYWAQRETIIKIRPDSILSFKSTVVSPGTLRLSIDQNIATSKTEWFSGTTATGSLVSNDATPSVNVPAGTFGLYSLRVTTPKGSKATVTSYVSDRGVLKDATTKGFFSVSRDNNSGATSGEGSLKLIDNSINTKFLQFDYNGDLWVQFDYERTPRVITAFLLTTGDDAPDRDPKNFSLVGSDDGQTWRDVFVVNNYKFVETPRKSTVAFSFTNTTAYRFYRINFSANNGSGLIQMGELRLLELPR